MEEEVINILQREGFQLRLGIVNVPDLEHIQVTDLYKCVRS